MCVGGRACMQVGLAYAGVLVQRHVCARPACIPVRVAAAASLVGYAWLVAVATPRPHWHVAVLVALFTLCTAAISEFQIGRVRMPRS